MTPELRHKVTQAWEQYRQLPAEHRQNFLEQLRATDTEVAAELETLLRQHQASALADDLGTVDWTGQASSIKPATPPSTTAHVPEDLPQQAGRYVIQEKIAQGGMGAVLRAVDPEMQRTLAVKVMLPKVQHDPEARRRFLEEARITGQLQHPGIPPIHDIGELDDGSPFFVMKLIEGRTLSDLLKTRGDRRPAYPEPTTGEPPVTTDLPRFLAIFAQICQTLGYAHSRGIIHRDLKPHNIMVGAFGEVQVMDWGLAKTLANDDLSRNREAAHKTTAIQQCKPEAPAKDSSQDGTQHGVAMGTPAYMAPEQARGDIAELDERCDVFGLGAILCQMLTGQPAFQGNNKLELLRQAADGNLTDVFARLDACGADTELIELCKHCLAAKQEDRPRDAGEVALRVDEYVAAVQARLQQAKIDAAEANVRAESEQKQRALAEGKALAERKRRQATVVMAVVALVLVSVLGIGVLAAWQQSSLEHKRYEAGIQKIYELLEQYRFDEAKETRAQLWQGLSFWVPQTLRQQLEQAKQDIALTKALDGVRLDRATIRDGKFDNPVKTAADYETALQMYGLSITDSNSATAVLDKLQSRHPVVKQHVIAVLDDWAALSVLKESQQRWLLKVARELDEDDPVRRELRQQRIWNNPKAIAKLMKKLDLKKASPHLLGAISSLMASNPGNQAGVQFLQQSLEHHPRDFWLLFRLGTAYSSQDQPDLEIGCYRAASAVRPNVGTVFLNWGSALAKKKDFDGAIAKYQRAIQLDPKDAGAYNNWGTALAGKKDYDGAIARYQQAIQTDPKFAPAYSNWGKALNEKKEFDRAIEKCKQAIQLDPKNAHAFNHWGSALANQKDYDAAIAMYQQAIQLDPKFASAYSNWGGVLTEKKDYDGAIAMYKQATQLDPKYDPAYTNWGLALVKKNDFDGAIAVCQRAAQLDPKSAEAYNNWGMALAAKKDYDGAIAKYRQAAQLDPKFAKAYNNWGINLADKNDFDGAIVKYQHATQLDPKYAQAFCNWGASLTEKKDFDGAIAKFQLATQLDPKYAKAYTGWGVALLHKKDYDSAIALYQQATQLDPEDVVAYSNWGLALVEMNNFDAAIAKFQQATQLNSNYANAYHNWGRALSRMNNFDAAIAKYRQATQLAPKSAQPYTGWGVALLHKKDFDNAIAKFQQAIALQPRYAEAHGGLGDALLDNGQFAKAVEAFQTLQKLVPDTHPFWRVAQQRIQQGRTLLALEKKLPAVLLGKLVVSPQEQLNLCILCQQYKKRYRDAAHLYSQLFAKQPKFGEDLKYQDRYNAACCALLAAAGKGVHAKKIDSKERNKLRKQAMTWLQADLQGYHKTLKKNRLSSFTIGRRLRHWQSDPDLSSVHGKKAIAHLPKPEQQAWQQLWSDVRSLQKTIRAAYTESRIKGTLTDTKREQPHLVQMTAGNTYVLTMQSKQFDTFLRLTDAKRKQLAENDDITPGKNLNSRIVFQPKRTGTYQLIATSYQQRGRGAYDITIHEFKPTPAPAKKPPANKPPATPISKTQGARPMPGEALVRVTRRSCLVTFHRLRRET